MVDPLTYFSFQPVLHDSCNKGHGVCFTICGMVHMKEPLQLIRKSSPCGSSRKEIFYLTYSTLFIYGYIVSEMVCMCVCVCIYICICIYILICTVNIVNLNILGFHLMS